MHKVVLPPRPREIEIEEHDGLVLLYRPGDPRVLIGWFIAREGEIVDGVWKELTR